MESDDEEVVVDKVEEPVVDELEIVEEKSTKASSKSKRAKMDPFAGRSLPQGLRRRR